MARKVNMAVAVAVAANATNLNVFTGQSYERAPFNAFLTLLDTGSAAGLERQLLLGSELVIAQSPVNTNNRVPIMPDDLIVAGTDCYFGTLVQGTVVNTTAGALTYRGRVEFEEAESY